MPFINRDKAKNAEAYIEIVPADRIAEGVMTPVQIGNRKIILTRHDGQLVAIDALCPHAAADLSKGSLRGWQICCHEHDYCFDIRNGRIVWPEDEVYRLKRYEVREDEGRVFVRLIPIK